MYNLKPTLLALCLTLGLAACDDDPASPDEPIDNIPLEQPVDDSDTGNGNDNDADSDNDSGSDTGGDDTSSESDTDSGDEHRLANLEWRESLQITEVNHLYDRIFAVEDYIILFANEPLRNPDEQPAVVIFREGDFANAVGTSWLTADVASADRAGSVFRPSSNDNRHTFAAVNDLGQFCLAWPEYQADPEPENRIKAACYDTATEQWGDPFIVMNGRIGVREARMVDVGSGQFALVTIVQVEDIGPASRSQVRVAFFSADGPGPDFILSDEGYFEDLHVSRRDNGGVNALYSEVRDDELESHILTLTEVDTANTVATQTLDNEVTLKSSLQITEGDTPNIAYVSTPDDPTIEGDKHYFLHLLNTALQPVDVSVLGTDVFAFLSLRRDAEGRVFFSWSSNAEGGSAATSMVVNDEIVSVEYHNDHYPYLVKSGNEIVQFMRNYSIPGFYLQAFMRYLETTDNGSQPVWSEPQAITCEDAECSDRNDISRYAAFTFYAISDEIVAVMYGNGDGQYLISAPRPPVAP